MGDLDFNEIAVSGQWASATWALQKLAATPGASRGSALAELKHVYKTGEVTFRGGAPFRWRTTAYFAALNNPCRARRPDVPLPRDQLIIFDETLRLTHKLTMRDAKVIAAPRLDTAPRVAWVLSCLTDDLRKQWPSVFAPIATGATQNDTKEDPPLSFRSITDAMKYVIAAEPSLQDMIPGKRDEIIEGRLKELSKKQFGNEGAYRCQSPSSLRRNIQTVIKKRKEPK